MWHSSMMDSEEDFDSLMNSILYASKIDSLGGIRDVLQPYYQRLVDLYENDLLALEGDYRSGKETYEYESLESIQGNLSYISDRWRVAFRVRWLIELINPDYVMYRKSL